MSRIYRSTDKRLPKELRQIFDEVSGTKRSLSMEIQTKSFDAEEEMIVEGIANLAKPDRWNEIIVPSAWKLDNFKRNPVILYQHEQDQLIGKALDVQVKDDGLYYRAQIGNPKVAQLTDLQIKVRSLIAQGILKTNSVGFYPHVWEWDDDAEVLRYTDVELLEISIVAIPMQQDSLITNVKSWRSKMASTPAAAPTPAAQPATPATPSTKAAADSQDDENDDDQPTQKTVHKAVMDCKDAVGAAHEDVKAMKDGFCKMADYLGKEKAGLLADIAKLKETNEALTKENGELKTKSAALLQKLTDKGLLKKQ